VPPCLASVEESLLPGLPWGTSSLPSLPIRRSGGSAGHQRPGAQRKRPRPAAGIVPGGRLFFPCPGE
jgi:hypothetical protein